MTIVDRLECPWTPRRNARTLPSGRAAEGAPGRCIELARWCFPDLDAPSLVLVATGLDELFSCDALRDAPSLSSRWLDAISERCGVGWREQIEMLFAEHASSARWERTWRERRQAPPLNEYLWHRPRAGGVYLYLSLGPALRRLAPSSPEWRDLRLQTALVAAADHIGWSNDLAGADRERAEEDLVNLPSILQHHGGLSPRAAIDETIRRCNEAARTVQRCVAALEVVSSRTSAWAGGAPWLGEMLAGHLAWCRGRARSHRGDERFSWLPQSAVA